MTVECGWYSRQARIILVRYIGDWTLEDPGKVVDCVSRLVAGENKRFDIIADMTPGRYTPPVGALSVLREFAEDRHIRMPDWGLTIYAAQP